METYTGILTIIAIAAALYFVVRWLKRRKAARGGARSGVNIARKEDVYSNSWYSTPMGAKD